jgi:hypothetical protein
MRVVIELRRGEVPEVMLNNLYAQTQLQAVFGINIVALIDGRPPPEPQGPAGSLRPSPSRSGDPPYRVRTAQGASVVTSLKVRRLRCRTSTRSSP